MNRITVRFDDMTVSKTVAQLARESRMTVFDVLRHHNDLVSRGYLTPLGDGTFLATAPKAAS